MKFVSLGSGSKGNATLVTSGDTSVLVDCGFTLRQTEKRLARVGASATDLNALLVTHEHSDHWAGVEALAVKYHTPIYLTAGSARAGNGTASELMHIIDSHADFIIGDLAITPVPVPHDSREPVQFIIAAAGFRLGLLTDLGYLTPHVVALYKSCDGLLLEANHDPEILAKGSYPAFLKSRVSGDWGHLSNQQAVDFLSLIDQQRIQHILLGHISQQNNCLNRLQDLLTEVLSDATKVHYATQSEGSDWLAFES